MPAVSRRIQPARRTGQMEVTMNHTQSNKTIDPVCGMELEPGESGLSVRRKGRTYHFCSSGCKDAFEKQPAQADGCVRDVICGMDVNPAATPHSQRFQGRTYFFCSQGCRKAFQRRAARMFRTKGAFGRWLDRLARQNESEFGSGGPKCH